MEPNDSAMQTVEAKIQESMFNSSKEKTFVDKIMGVKTAERVTLLIKKSPLTREDMNELFSYLSSPEQKLLNFDPHNRYVVLKYFVWIADFVKIAQNFYDYDEYLEKNRNVCASCEGNYNKCKCLDKEQGEIVRNLIYYYNNQMEIINEKLSSESKKLKKLKDIKIKRRKVEIEPHFEKIFENTRIVMENNVKFLVSVYFNVCRTTLSINSAGFKSILSNKFEVDYKNNSTSVQSFGNNENNNRGFLRGN